MTQKQLMIAGAALVGILIYFGVLMQLIVLTALTVILLNMRYPTEMKDFKESLKSVVKEDDKNG